MSEIADTFAVNARRRELFDGLVRGARSLAAAGCQRMYVDGSYVTAKPDPGDYDVCWDRDGVDERLLDPVLLDLSDFRAAQKARYGGEFFPAEFHADGMGHAFLRFFQHERLSGGRKGVVVVNLVRDPTVQSEVST